MVPLRVPEEMKEQVAARAAARGMSTNAWLNLAIGHALSGAHKVKITTTTTTEATL